MDDERRLQFITLGHDGTADVAHADRTARGGKRQAAFLMNLTADAIRWQEGRAGRIYDPVGFPLR